jgi:hypothetical protein
MISMEFVPAGQLRHKRVDWVTKTKDAEVFAAMLDELRVAAGPPSGASTGDHQDVEEEATFQEELADDGYHVFFAPPHYPPDEIDAELPDGTIVPSVLQHGGQRLGFDRTFPAGTWVRRRGVRAWGPVGSPPR